MKQILVTLLAAICLALPSKAAIGTLGSSNNWTGVQIATNSGNIFSPIIGSNIVGVCMLFVYTNPGTFTWRMPTNCISLHVVCIGPGGGGGSGGNTNSGTAIYGGGGGAAGGISMLDMPFPLTVIGPAYTSVTVTVGAGGAGGAGQTMQGTAGNNGGNGSAASSFGTWCIADANNGGSAGTTASGAGGTVVGANFFASEPAGGASSITAAAASPTAVHYGNPGSGGGGGGVSSSPIAYAGGAGSAGCIPSYLGTVPGGAINGGSISAPFVRNAYLPYGGNGGSGSGAGTTAASVNGQNGVFPGGGGGGSGATIGSVSIYVAGAGGNGANGMVYVQAIISQ